MKIPKSKYYVKNIIKTIQIDSTTIEIEVFYDTTHKGMRYSCSIRHTNGSAICAGYGTYNEITHTTYDSILTKAFEMSNLDKDLIREYKLNILLES